MEQKILMMWRLCVNRFHQKDSDAYFKVVPQEQTKLLLGQDVSSANLTSLLSSSLQNLQRVHYSWLPQVLEQFSKPMIPLFIAALPEDQAASLRRIYTASQDPIILTKPSKLYLQDLICKHLYPKEILPIIMLPKSPFNFLIDSNKKDIMELIDFLGLYDLAEEIRHIVDQKQLKTIYMCLTSRKQQFLRQCLYQKDKLVAPKLGLNKWSGECDQLEKILHKRGLFRLGKALCGQHKDLVWYFTHVMDTGRSTILQQFYSEKSIPGITPILVQQVLNVMNLIKKKSEP